MKHYHLLRLATDVNFYLSTTILLGTLYLQELFFLTSAKKKSKQAKNNNNNSAETKKRQPLPNFCIIQSTSCTKTAGIRLQKRCRSGILRHFRPMIIQATQKLKIMTRSRISQVPWVLPFTDIIVKCKTFVLDAACNLNKHFCEGFSLQTS